MVSIVVIIGGGYGGVSAAKALDDVADVVLIDPGETFVHNVGALRAVVDPDWAARLFIPYDGLLARGQVRRDRAVRVWATGVELSSGATIAADYTILSTGSSFPYPAKFDAGEKVTAGRAGALDRLAGTHQELARASRVLLLGAGPVGLEFAGEIKAAWPDKAVIIVDPAPDLVSGRFPDEFRAELRAQLDAMGVDLLLGTSLRALPPAARGLAGTFTVTTRAGAAITADIWFPCYGASPSTGYLAGDLAAARRSDGLIAVTPELRLHGQRNVFAIGDITAIPEMKMARLAQKHAEVAAANIRTLIESGSASELASYRAEPDAIVLPLGPKGGVSYAPEVGVLGPGQTSDIKGTLYVDRYLDLLGAAR